MKTKMILQIALLVLIIVFPPTARISAAAWQPSKAVEFIIMAAKEEALTNTPA